MDHVTELHRKIQGGILPDLSYYQTLMGKTSPYDVIMATNRNGDTAFHIAARHGHMIIMRQLHEKIGIGLNHVNSDGKNALHEAAQNGHMECVCYLIETGCYVDCLKRADWTPLMLACSKSDLNIVTTLIDYGASLKLTNKDGWTPFHIASREGNVDVLLHLLKVDPFCWDTRSNNGRTPLHTVALHGRLEAMQLFHKKCGYDVNATDSCGISPLMDAVRGNHLNVTQFLLKSGANLYQEDVLGRRCIHLGAQAGSVQVLDYIITEGSDVNKTAGRNGTTPLHYAAKEGQADAIVLLLQFGSDPSTTDSQGRTALDIARKAREGDQAVKILVQHQRK